MNENFGFLRVAAAIPIVDVANPKANVERALCLVYEAVEKRSQLVVFQELSLTGYTCGDLFHQLTLQNAALKELGFFLYKTLNTDCLIVVGLPLRVDDQLFNVAAVCQQGNLLAFIPKTFLPNYKEFYETRWFAPVSRLKSKEIELFGKKVPIGTDIIIKTDIPGFSLGVEICEDLWMPIPPSSHAALQGASVLVNLSASNGLVGKADYRRELVSQQSARCISAYVYTSCGYGESTADVVFDGHAMIAENGNILKESERYTTSSQLLISDIDMERLKRERVLLGSFGQSVAEEKTSFRTVTASIRTLNFNRDLKLERFVDPYPFIPSNPVKLDERCQEVFQLETMGLMRRLEHVGCKEVAIGVSGGLDSTLALIVACKAVDQLGWDRKQIVALTMPGFGTTDRTYKNALALMQELGVTLREISIVKSTLLHLNDIGHDKNSPGHETSCLVCQNSQARERTQILMDTGFTIGTGDLSEVALGWCTYNGDHMSMYHVNCGAPKTLVKYIISWAAKKNILGKKVSVILNDIVDTPISPELEAASDGGEIIQKTEDLIGPYVLNDFFLFQVLRNGFEPAKIFFLAENAFKKEFDRETIKKWLKEFYRRFFIAQFKRDASPNGPKIGSVALSQRGDWRMPSDITGELWLKKVEEI